MVKRILGTSLLLIATLFLIREWDTQVGWVLGLSIGVVWALVVLSASCLIMVSFEVEKE